MISKFLYNAVFLLAFCSTSLIFSSQQQSSAAIQPHIIYVPRNADQPQQGPSSSFFAWAPYVALAAGAYAIYDYWHNDGKKTRTLIKKTKTYLFDAYQVGTDKIMKLVNSEHVQTRKANVDQHDKTRGHVTDEIATLRAQLARIEQKVDSQQSSRSPQSPSTRNNHRRGSNSPLGWNFTWGRSNHEAA